MTLTMTDDRLREIVAIVKRISGQGVYTLPVDIERLCRSHGARMTSLEDAAALGLDPEIVTRCIGNRDGVANEGRRVWGIIYNKNAPVNRLRFTLAEELMHHLLGHTKDPRFNALAPSYSPEVYAEYEEEAKIAADLLLIQPGVFYRYRRLIGVGGLAKLFAVSAACLWTAAQVYNEKEDVIRQAWGLSVPADMERISERAAQLVRERRPVRVSI